MMPKHLGRYNRVGLPKHIYTFSQLGPNMRKYILPITGLLLLTSLALGATNCHIDQTAIQISSENTLVSSSLIQTGYSEASAAGSGGIVYQQINQRACQDILLDSLLLQDTDQFAGSYQYNNPDMWIGDSVVSQDVLQIAEDNLLEQLSVLVQLADQSANASGEVNLVRQAAPQTASMNELFNSTLMQDISNDASIDGINCTIDQMILPEEGWADPENLPGQVAQDNMLIYSVLLQEATNIASIEPDYYVGNDTFAYYEPSVASSIVQNTVQKIAEDQLNDSTIAETSENIARILGGELQVDWLPCV